MSSPASSKAWTATARVRQTSTSGTEKELDKLTQEKVAVLEGVLAHKEQELLEL